MKRWFIIGLAGLAVLALTAVFGGAQDYSNSGLTMVVDGDGTFTMGTDCYNVRGYLVWSEVEAFRLHVTYQSGDVDTLWWTVPGTSITLPGCISTIDVAHTDSVYAKALQ